MKAATAVAAAVVAVLLLPGCLDPFRVRVDPVVLGAAPGWVLTSGGSEGAWYDEQRLEMRYTLDRGADDPPPFSGTLQVFSLRGLATGSDGRLEGQANRLAAAYAEQYKVEDLQETDGGTREIVSGVDTSWRMRDGRTIGAGALFAQDVGVRLFTEWGHDGRSDTSFIAIALVQVSRDNQCPADPLNLPCQPVETNLQTWIQVVGDAEGTVQGATSSSGFVDSLVTR